MKRTLTALTVAATMFASNASAFDPADLRKLFGTNECVSCDLRGADLTYADLGGADLRGAYLTGANLYGANLRGANLIDADLSAANLEGANLGAASLEGANLGGGAYMNGAILCNTTVPDGSVIYSGC